MSACAFIVRPVLLVAVLPLVVRAGEASSDVCAATEDNARLVPISCGQVVTETVPRLSPTNETRTVHYGAFCGRVRDNRSESARLR